MKYSIIIPTYNKCNELLKPCIESIIKYTDLQGEFCEIIVVANGCTDNTRQYVHEKSAGNNIRYIEFIEPIGFTKAVNYGMLSSKADYIVILNNDTILLEQDKNSWLDILNKPFRESSKVGLTGPMKVPNDGTGLPFLIFFCVMVSRKCYDNIGPMDEIFSPGYGEDTDWCLRAEGFGFECVQVPEATDKYYEDKRMVGNFPIYHAGNQTFKDYPDPELIHRNNQILIDRYGNKPKETHSSVNIENAKRCDGYMADSELEFLATEARKYRDAKIIEVGSWHGKSSRAIADNLSGFATLYCVDHWKGSETERDNNHQSASLDNGDHAFLEFLDNTSDLIEKHNVVPIRLSSVNAAKVFARADFGAKMIFIDAGHTREEVKEDILAWLPLLEEDGVICGHDAFHANNTWPGVREAVYECFDTSTVENPPNTSIWLVRNPKLKEPRRSSCLYDCFPFNNEVDVLKERLEKLYTVVDRFVIVEAKETHAGKPKDLVFEQHLDVFSPYLNKITYLVIEKFPEFEGSVTDKSWARERYQRDYIMNGLTDCQNQDFVIISDCDEIPSPDAIYLFQHHTMEEIAAFEMDLFYYNRQTKAKDKWWEAKITTYRKLKELGPCGIRYSQKFSRLYNAGEHLSYFGGTQAIIKKIEDTAHQEYNTSTYKDPTWIEGCVNAGIDIFSRQNIEFERV